ncbi:transcriptional regulator [Alsobacter soli]|uniref:Transcriptional regulator n=1 Tax=Alsobacter soli TaxID=2109933 RepID=A0A2T1HWW0_9HYPH|nr:LysR family transcriptional regulator [Alsobacter soli]PSC06068.1 transcriptional regulator [Alsobacter soli]
MNLRRLRYLIGIIDAGNMTRAAAALNVAQTALSAQIRQLEDDLGIALLRCHSRGIEPTEAGRLLDARGLVILRSIEEARRDAVALAATREERVRFGITPALMLIIGADLLERVARECPQVSLALVEAMSHILLPDLLSGALDVVLCYDLPDDARIERTAFLREDLVFVSRPGVETGDAISLDDALRHTLAMPEEPDTLRLAVAAAAREIGAELKVSQEVRSISAMKTLAIRGTASCVLPMAAVSEEVAAGMLEARPIVMPSVRRTLYLAWSAQRPNPRCHRPLAVSVRAALSGLLEVLGQLAHPL